MRPLYVTEPLPALLFWAAYGAWFLFEIMNMIRLQPSSGAAENDRGSRLGLIAGTYLTIFTGFGVAFAVPGSAVTWERHLLFYSGLVVLTGGILLRAYAIRILGQSFTLDVRVRPAQVVIDAGPYRWIRHPAYSGSLLTVIGILACATNWLAFACLLPVILGYAYRIAVEEQVLIDQIGQPYVEYMRRTKRLIPFLL